VPYRYRLSGTLGLEMSEPSVLPISSIQKRITAFVIDDMIVAVLMLIIFYDQLMQIASHLPHVLTQESIEVFKNEINHFSVDNLLLILALKIIYHTFFVWQNGMTLGKYFMKIKVIELNTVQNPTFIKALFRAIFRIVSEVIFYLGFVLAFFLPLRQTLHDKLSSCVVVDA